MIANSYKMFTNFEIEYDTQELFKTSTNERNIKWWFIKIKCVWKAGMSIMGPLVARATSMYAHPENSRTQMVII